MADLSFSQRKFLLDTCILQDISSESQLATYILAFLGKLTAQQNSFAISDFATFELLRGASQKIEAKRQTVLNLFQRYATDNPALLVAARLETLYKKQGVDSGISDGDKVLAATSVLTGCPVITRDQTDFPIPFFQEIHREIITYQGARGNITRVVLILQPDSLVISNRFNERE